jgi:arabinan endo-1,5-alpha-L-arabinosidase
MANPVPVVESMPNRTVIDPAVVQDGNQRYIFFGTFQGGIAARQLSPDGMSSDPASQVQITAADRYEATYVIRHDGYFYLMVSSGSCCNGVLSGYGVSVGRSTNVLGPYIDRDGHSLLDPYVGGTPVASMNGNRWLGPGHNAVFTDAAGNDWMLYHAVDAAKPFFWGSWTRRPLMMDPLLWIDGWPRLRGGAGPSDEFNSVPALSTTADSQVLQNSPQDIPEELLASYSDEFNTAITPVQWKWLRSPADTAYGVADGALRIDTQEGALQFGRHDASALAEAAPVGDYLVETKLSLNVPAHGYFNNVQAGLVLYADDDNYIKLVSVAINQTRQIEFGKQATPAIMGEPEYGSAFLASAEPVIYLRIVKRTNAGFGGADAYTAYSSHDGVNWERGATWTHSLGSAPKIGLVSMGGAGYSAFFDYVRVYTLSR